MNLDAAIDSLLSPIADKVSGFIFSYVTIGGVKVEFLIALLMAAAIYFTLRTGCIGFWGFKHAIKLITNNYVHNNPGGYQRKKKGELSSFQALSGNNFRIGRNWKCCRFSSGCINRRPGSHFLDDYSRTFLNGSEIF